MVGEKNEERNGEQRESGERMKKEKKKRGNDKKHNRQRQNDACSRRYTSNRTALKTKNKQTQALFR
jgi:predicted phage gp36 major capsid-like protein